MAPGDYIELVPPIIVLLFAGAFAAVWRFDRTVRGVAPFALAYLAGGIGLANHYLLSGDREVLYGLPSNGPYLLTAVLIAGATMLRIRGRVDRWGIGAIALPACALYLAHLDAEHVTLRAWVMHLTGAGLYAVTVWRCWPHATDILQRLLLAVLVLTGLLYVARMGALVGFDQDALREAAYGLSPIATTTRFVSAISAMCSGMILLMMFAAEIVEKLAAEAEHDLLTGLLNRRGLERRVDAAVEPAASGSVIVADLDRFKSINDMHGHATGDEVLRVFAGVLERTVREDDWTVRLGGEEFAIVLRGAGTNVARLIAEGVRVATETTDVALIGGERVTASFGIAAWSPSESLASALRQADMALYAAKNGGRNRVVIAGEAGDAPTPSGPRRSRAVHPVPHAA